MIRVLVVEDRVEVRLGLQMRLGAEPDMEVVGLAGNGFCALGLAEELAPDVVLMDVEMPVQDGIETCCLLHGRHPDLPVVFLTIHDDEQTRGRAAAAHGAAFVSKQKSVDTLLTAIRNVAGCATNSCGHAVARLK